MQVVWTPDLRESSARRAGCVNFPALDPHTSYDFEMLEFNMLHFSALDGTDSPHGNEGANQYIFVAPTDVQFEEFVVDSARFLN